MPKKAARGEVAAEVRNYPEGPLILGQGRHCLGLEGVFGGRSQLRASSMSLESTECCAEEGRLQAASDQNVGMRLAEEERALMLPAGHLKSDN